MENNKEVTDLSEEMKKMTLSVVPAPPALFTPIKIPIPRRVRRPQEEKEAQPTQPEEKETHPTQPEEKETHPTQPTQPSFQRVLEKIEATDHTGVRLLRERTVVQWLYGDMSFLSPIPCKTKGAYTAMMKVKEDQWGQQIMRERRPDLKMNKQWTNRFGEYLCEELLFLLGKTPKKPKKINHFQPDVESEEAIWEAKAQTYHTVGTAGEKILGVPLKYAEIPRRYSKQLNILCIGRAEKQSKEEFGTLTGYVISPEKKILLATCASLRIYYLGYTDVLDKWASVL
jgi:hypothetical protein